MYVLHVEYGETTRKCCLPALLVFRFHDGGHGGHLRICNAPFRPQRGRSVSGLLKTRSLTACLIHKVHVPQKRLSSAYIQYNNCDLIQTKPVSGLSLLDTSWLDLFHNYDTVMYAVFPIYAELLFSNASLLCHSMIGCTCIFHFPRHRSSHRIIFHIHCEHNKEPGWVGWQLQLKKAIDARV